MMADHKMTLGLLVAILLALLVAGAGCGSLYAGPPDHIKDVGAFTEGGGIEVWFSLATQDGQFTVADGVATVSILENDSYPYQEGGTWKWCERYISLWSGAFEIKKDDFHKTTVSDREVVLYSFPMVTQDDFHQQPVTLKGFFWAQVQFVTWDGKEMELISSDDFPLP